MHIERETYTGRYTKVATPGKLRSDEFTAAELTAMGTVGVTMVLWEFHGHVNGGRELFGRTRFVPQEDGSLYGFNSVGEHIITHPATRKIRIITN